MTTGVLVLLMLAGMVGGWKGVRQVAAALLILGAGLLLISTL